MKIDLHCHTKKVKTGDAYTRNVTENKFFKKLLKQRLKLLQ